MDWEEGELPEDESLLELLLELEELSASSVPGPASFSPSSAPGADSLIVSSASLTAGEAVGVSVVVEEGGELEGEGELVVVVGEVVVVVVVGLGASPAGLVRRGATSAPPPPPPPPPHGHTVSVEVPGNHPDIAAVSPWLPLVLGDEVGAGGGQNRRSGVSGDNLSFS